MRLSIPEPPPDLPYEDLEDWHDWALLEANGLAPTLVALVAALDGDDVGLRPVAA